MAATAVVNPATLPRTRDIDLPHAIIIATFPVSFSLILPSMLILGLVLKSFIRSIYFLFTLRWTGIQKPRKLIAFGVFLWVIKNHPFGWFYLLFTEINTIQCYMVVDSPHT